MDTIRTQGKETGGLGIAMVQRIMSNWGERVSVIKAKEVIDYLQATGEIEPKVGGGPATFPYTFTDKVPEKTPAPAPVPIPAEPVVAELPAKERPFESATQRGIRELNEVIDKRFPDRADVSKEPWVLRQIAEMWGEVHEGAAGRRIFLEDKKVGQGTNMKVIGEPSTYPEWFKNQEWGKDKVLMTIDKLIKGGKLGKLEERIADAMREEATKRFEKYKVEETDFLAQEKERKQIFDKDPDFLKDETFDDLTKTLDNEIISIDERLASLREELNVKGATPQEILEAVNKEREAHGVKEEPTNLQEIKESLTEPTPEPAKELVKPPELSPTEKGQFKLPGMKIGVGERPSAETPTLEGTPLAEAARKAELEKVQPKLFGEKVEPAPKPAAKLTAETLDLASIPENIIVEVKAIREKTGLEVTVKENAKKAMEDTIKFIDKYKSLLECLKA